MNDHLGMPPQLIDAATHALVWERTTTRGEFWERRYGDCEVEADESRAVARFGRPELDCEFHPLPFQGSCVTHLSTKMPMTSAWKSVAEIYYYRTLSNTHHTGVKIGDDDAWDGAMMAAKKP